MATNQILSDSPETRGHLPSAAKWDAAMRNLKFFSVVAATITAMILMAGCAPTILSSKKTSNYHGTIEKLSVVIVELELKSTAERGNYSANASAGTGFFMVRNLLEEDLPNYFATHGISTALFPKRTDGAVVDPSDGSSHMLMVIPTSSSALCSQFGSCNTTVRVAFSLSEVSSKKVVWTSEIDVPIVTKVGANKDLANQVGALLVGEFGKQGFLRVAR